MTSPDYLPSLSAGAHDADDGEACVMEYVSLLAGEAWSDRPECTHPLLAHEVRMLNDGPALTARLRLRQVAAVLRLLDPSVRVRVAAVVARAEREASRLDGSDLEGIDRTRGDLPLDRESDDAPTIEEARETARSFPCPETVSDDPAHAAHHLSSPGWRSSAWPARSRRPRRGRSRPRLWPTGSPPPASAAPTAATARATPGCGCVSWPTCSTSMTS